MLREEYTTSIDLLADSIADAVALDVENREHYVELNRFDYDLPTKKEERAEMLDILVSQVRHSIEGPADVFLKKDEDGKDILYIKER